MKSVFIKSTISGILIAIGCTVYLSCDNKYIGAVLFTVALCAICNLKLLLFTGGVCYINKIRDIPEISVCLIGNIIGCLLAGVAIRYSRPNVMSEANNLFNAKLQCYPLQTMILAIFCGLLMYIAVHTFNTQTGFSRYSGIITAIPVFILCGFEHSIANVAYFTISNMQFNINILILLILSVAGNIIGGTLIPNMYKFIK